VVQTRQYQPTQINRRRVRTEGRPERAHRSAGREGASVHLAYLDAGSGSLIVSAIVGGAAGAAVFAKLAWRRVTGVFRKGSSTPTPEAHAEADR
jgi:hypothetical protein